MEKRGVVTKSAGEPQFPGRGDKATGPQESRNTPGHIKFADLASTPSRLTPGSLTRAYWLFSPTCHTNLMQLADGAGPASGQARGASKT